MTTKTKQPAGPVRRTAAKVSPRRSAYTERAEPIDTHLGERVRAARTMRGRPRHWLAEQIGVSTVQVEKWERAANRLFANRLYAIAQALEVHPGWFFDGYVPGGSEQRLPAYDPNARIGPAEANAPDLSSKDNILAVMLFSQLNATQKTLAMSLLQQLGTASAIDTAEEDEEGETPRRRGS